MTRKPYYDLKIACLDTDTQCELKPEGHYVIDGAGSRSPTQEEIRLSAWSGSVIGLNVVDNCEYDSGVILEATICGCDDDSPVFWVALTDRQAEMLVEALASTLRMRKLQQEVPDAG